MPLFPLYAICESFGPAGTEIRAVSAWETARLEDGSSALLVFDSQAKAAVHCGTGRAIVTIENSYKFAATLRGLNGTDQPTKVCWNLRSDLGCDRIATIDAVLDFLAKLPPEAKGS